VHAWSVSTTYTHCFFIYPIVAWLIFERRKHLFIIPVTPWWPGLVLVAGALSIGYVGSIALVNFFSDLSLVLFPALAFVTIFGWRMSKCYCFPLAFSLFALPVGEELIPQLQQVTADISVAILRLVDIPVFRDGLYIDIPSGRFHVAEACSGVRFLISSVMMGALLGYFYFRRWRSRLAFLLFSIAVPILANGLRAFMIIIIGHGISMEHASGFDHLVYGWVFFALVTVFMFVVAAKLGKMRPLESEYQASEVADGPSVPALGQVVLPLIVLMLFSTAATWHYQQRSLQRAEAGQSLQLDGASKPWSPLIKNADSINYKTLGKIERYQIDYLSETDGKELINWQNQLYQPELWTLAEHGQLAVGGETIAWMVIASANRTEPRLLGYYYQVAENIYISRMHTKLAQLLGKMTGRDYGGRLVVYALPFRLGELEQAKQALVEQIQRDIASLGSHNP
jgi:exosortase A